jgi:cleavage and polyadenylation specificity factor subunit 2
VILASDTSLEWGFSRDVLKKIADDSRNLVILTERQGTAVAEGKIPSLASTLWTTWEERKAGVVLEPTKGGDNLEQVSTGGKAIEIRGARRVALEGQDLSVYQQYLATQRQLQTTVQAGGATSLESSADIVDDASSDSSSDSEGSDTEQQGKALNISATMGQANRKKIGLSDEDLGINVLIRRKGVYDYDVRGKKGREKMFPMAIRRKRNDEFGELIRPEDFIRAEERDEVDGQDMRQHQKLDTKDTLGKKRKWDDVATSNDRKTLDIGSKRQQMNRNQRESPELLDMPRGVEDDDSDGEAEEEISGPSKIVFSTETLKFNVRIAFVDFAGLHDKRSLQMLIPLIQPRKLILVSGMKEETLSLAIDCRKLLAAQIGASEGTVIDVYTPEVGVSVNASVDTNAWAVKLTDALVKRLMWQNLKGLSIATITARLAATDMPGLKLEGSNKKLKLLKEDGEERLEKEAQVATAPAEMPTLDVIPLNLASATRSVAQPLQVGDLRLAELRRMMQNEGHTAEFRGEGTLLIDGTVMVRKSGTGRIQVESIGWPASTGEKENTFYVVRNSIYKSLAVVK